MTSGPVQYLISYAASAQFHHDRGTGVTCQSYIYAFQGLGNLDFGKTAIFACEIVAVHVLCLVACVRLGGPPLHPAILHFCRMWKLGWFSMRLNFHLCCSH